VRGYTKKFGPGSLPRCPNLILELSSHRFKKRARILDPINEEMSTECRFNLIHLKEVI
jgi:hypothetical protein